MTELRNDRSAYGALETSVSLSDAQIEERARDLLSRFDLEEKIAMMYGDLPFWSGLAEMLTSYDRIWVGGEVPRLGIPGIRFSDGPRGVCLSGATTFPVTMARGATWDPELEEQVGDVMGRETRALGANLFGGVCINLLRHPAWGRAQETYGEDPVHLGELGAALTRGVQRHTMACVKHYALNSMENARFSVDVTVDDRALHEIYLPHFKQVVDEGVASVMSAYNSVNGVWCGQNRELLTDILKNLWGFRGFVVTDWILGMRDAREAALAGQDLEMPFWIHFYRHLSDLVASGEVPVERIDDAVLRMLRQQVRFAQGRNPADYTREAAGTEAHRALARVVAQKSIVLLRNEGGLLPLENVSRLAVIGRLADTPNTGDRGSSNTRPDYVITPLQGLREALGDDVVIHDDGSDLERAAAVAREADVALLVVGYTHEDEGEYIPPGMIEQAASWAPQPTPEEQPIVQRLMKAVAVPEQGHGDFSLGGDRARLELKPEDEALIAAVVEANPRTVVAIMAGSAVITEAWRGRVPAILMLWYPGMEGGRALADVLLGTVSPGGKLPCVFPKRAEHLPFFDRDATAITYDLWHGYRLLERDGHEPAFPFGYGLSYTTFALSDLRLESDEIGADDAAATLRATVTVTNTGARAGDEVAQLYIAAPGSRVERAPKELKAFARVSLAPGERRDVTLEAPVARLAYYDESQGWVVEPLSYEVIVGTHSLDSNALRASLTVRA
ncbi:MAG: beta-glucosidase [Anaerolineae bacterium]